MPKRKLDVRLESEESGLSSPPSDLDDNTALVVADTAQLAPSTKRTQRARETIVKTESKSVQTVRNSDKNGRGKKIKGEQHEQDLESVRSTKSLKQETEQTAEKETSPKKIKRKTKEEKAAEAMPLAARTAGHTLYIGAHVSSAGGVSNAVTNSVHIGANAFALFLKSQRKWANPPLLEDQCSSFRENCKTKAYDQSRYVVPHGSYLVNLAHTDAARTKQAFDSYLDDLQRCERLGITLYNIHPGNAISCDRKDAIAHLAANINRAHEQTKSVVTLLENMAAGGNVLGSTFEDLRDIITLVKDKKRIGVCIDTAHAFAGGYDLRSPEAWKKTMNHFEEIVGFKYLKAMHLNDSKAPFRSHRDLHANIGTGFLGLRAFHNLVNETRLAGLPLVLETPITIKDEVGIVLKDEKGKEQEDKGIWAKEIKLLESLVGMDAESEEFLRMAQRLAKQGEPDRRKCDEQFQRKLEKESKEGAKKRKNGKGKGKGKGKGALKGERTTDDSDLSSSEKIS